MNSLRSISRKIDAMLIMIIAGLVLSLALAWNYYQSRRMTYVEKETLAASLLAHSLPSEAAAVMHEMIQRQPVSERSLKLRRVLSEVYMNELNDFEKALAELVFINNFAPGTEVASGTEDAIRYCLNRLGRVYDVERRRLLEGGENPLDNTVNEASVVRLGNRHAISIDQVRQKLSGMKKEDLTKELVESVVNGMAQEMLLARAAERENIKKDSAFIETVRRYEKNLAINHYLQKKVLTDDKLSAEKQRELMTAEINRLAQLEEMKIDTDVIAREILGQTASPSAPANPQEK
ncbi:MAG: hypothetical protein GQF41_0333 [Candidatus Rifleibacterium amylolyticum]|nr:MAG: hypothetical protein GQF41_0333 [Candidatus Rifleibacterium amylolyticum]NLF95467.1 hypothetical protein [Candidatus Riflebacteria bacterium]